MSEQTTPQGEPADPQGSDEQPQGAPQPEPQGPDWKAEARKHEARAKQSAEQIRTLREQISNLVSPEQHHSVETQLATTTTERDAAALRALRLEVALEKGLPPALAKRLLGDTREDIEADADELLATAKPSAAIPAKHAGTAANGGQQPPDLNALLRQAARRD